MAIREYRVVPEEADQVAERVDRQWVSEVTKLPGFVSYHVVRPKPDRLFSLTSFVEEEQLDRAVELSAEWVGQWLFDLDVEFLSMSRGPVVVNAGSE